MVDENNNVGIEIIEIVHSDIQLQAILGLSRTTFVILILVFGALLFSKDANDYVVIPIEDMLSKVKRLAENPLEAMKMEEAE